MGTEECSEFFYIESNGYAYYICLLDDDEECSAVSPCGLEENKAMHEKLAKESP